MQAPVEVLEERLGYRFRNPELLQRALTHRSRSSEHPGLHNALDNERLEFLGDSILGFVVSEALVAVHPKASEGQLSTLKAHVVSSPHLHRCAVALGLGSHLLLGKSQELSGGRERRTLLVDALEAIIAAIHLDGGIEAARQFVKTQILDQFQAPDQIESLDPMDYKGALQEKARLLGLPAPKYSVVDTRGPDHSKVFTIEVRVGHQAVQSSGSSKKSASQDAAQQLLQKLNTA